jgi:hypothetical protein
MLKEEFNKLDIKKQVEYINSKLPLKTLTKACDELEIARSTITGRFKKRGYTLNIEQNKYMLDKSTGEYNYNDIKQVINIKEIIEKENKDNDIKELLEMKDKIKVLIKWFDEEQARTIQKDFNIQMDKFEGEPISRTFVLYPNVLERYVKFCESYRAYRRQDIFSKAIVDFLDEHE